MMVTQTAGTVKRMSWIGEQVRLHQTEEDDIRQTLIQSSVQGFKRIAQKDI